MTDSLLEKVRSCLFIVHSQCRIRIPFLGIQIITICFDIAALARDQATPFKTQSLRSKSFILIFAVFTQGENNFQCVLNKSRQNQFHSPTSHPILTQFSLTSHQLLTHFSPTSRSLLTNFSPTSHLLLTQFSPTSRPRLTYFSPTVSIYHLFV